MFNLPSFVFAGVAYQATSMLSTETIGIGVAIMAGVVIQQFLNLVKEGTVEVSVSHHGAAVAQTGRKAKNKSNPGHPLGEDPFDSFKSPFGRSRF